MKTNLFLEMIFPRRCAICDTTLPWGEKEICAVCKNKIQYSSGTSCLKCGKPVKEEEEYCYDCKKKKHDFKKIYDKRNMKTNIALERQENKSLIQGFLS